MNIQKLLLSLITFSSTLFFSGCNINADVTQVGSNAPPVATPVPAENRKTPDFIAGEFVQGSNGFKIRSGFFG